MSLFGFNFGKKRRKVRKMANQKPPSRLLRICKKYRVKATMKRGGKRVYKPVKTLKKECLRKAMAMKKKLMKKLKKGTKHKKTRTHRRRSMMMFGAAAKAAAPLGMCHNINPKQGNGIKVEANCNGPTRVWVPNTKFGRTRRSYFGNVPIMGNVPMFGKRRRVGRAKTSKKAAMKAFSSFYKRHCDGKRRRGGMMFGNGGNPSLSTSMGYEFCADGTGGVLGSDSTGLFPSPCGPSSSFGVRRRRRSPAIGSVCRRRRSPAVGGVKRRSPAVGDRRRRRSAM